MAVNLTEGQMAESSRDARISIRLSPAARRAVEDIKDLGGFETIQEAVRRAIGDELFLQQQRKQGWTVQLRKGNEYKELVWPST
jgi:hypothetical protein